ncbi:hypothetical protein [Fodinibius salsisoli]|uniref:HNH endonuclease n=1 Tax=Fodinibius salsisoli TaxID=2820877 RepID=A0ABT3PTR6_9BACT|nr:hypothetical protein [Fodinibius salsisoli]MCW9709260.1 hypothetical protein [Fodinibius salsisoli]
MANQNCIYCLERDANSKDHTPPKNLFPKDKRNDLITVPCCKKCNRSFSKDEEYCRAVISSTGQSQRNPSAKEILTGKVFRSLERDQAKGFRNYLRKSISPALVYSGSGIYLGRGSKIKVQMERVYNVIKKTVQGLVFHETELTVSDEYEIKSQYIDSVQQVQQLFTIFRNCPIKRIFSDDIFSYRAGIIEENTPISSWLITIYDSHIFLVNIVKD